VRSEPRKPCRAEGRKLCGGDKTRINNSTRSLIPSASKQKAHPQAEHGAEQSDRSPPVQEGGYSPAEHETPAKINSAAVIPGDEK
jgi:hypothetical protein